VLHLAAHTQCWASHCLHLRAAEEKQRRGRTRAQKNESASALQPPASSCLNLKPIFGAYICSPYSEAVLFHFFLTTGLVAPPPPVFPGAPGLWCRGAAPPGLFPVSPVFPRSLGRSLGQVFSRRAFHISYLSALGFGTLATGARLQHELAAEIERAKHRALWVRARAVRPPGNDATTWHAGCRHVCVLSSGSPRPRWTAAKV
jgi:hypothetical protein